MGFNYNCPTEGPRASYAAHVDALPLTPDPGAFGLHPNADIAKDMSAADAMLSSLLGMGGGGGAGAGGAPAEREGAAGGGSAKAEEARLARVVEECLGSLPAPFDLETVGARFPVCYEESMNTVLVQVGGQGAGAGSDGWHGLMRGGAGDAGW